MSTTPMSIALARADLRRRLETNRLERERLTTGLEANRDELHQLILRGLEAGLTIRGAGGLAALSGLDRKSVSEIITSLGVELRRGRPPKEAV